jgi:hypothetical protein
MNFIRDSVTTEQMPFLCVVGLARISLTYFNRAPVPKLFENASGFNLKTAVKENENGADTRKHAGF